MADKKIPATNFAMEAKVNLLETITKKHFLYNWKGKAGSVIVSGS